MSIATCSIGIDPVVADAVAVKVDMLKRGIVVRGVGESIIFCPPLVITDAEIGQFIETLHEALR